MTTAMKALVVLDHRVDRSMVETLVTFSRQLDVAEFVDLASEASAHGNGEQKCSLNSLGQCIIVLTR